MRLILALISLAVIVGMFIGWVKNFVALLGLFGASGDHLIEALIRCVGVVIPFIGGIVGWF